MMIDLYSTPCSHNVSRLSSEDTQNYLSTLDNWVIEKNHLVKQGHLNSFDELSAFIDFVIHLSKNQDHHPEVQFGYKEYVIRYTTHSVDSLSVNDFICAAHIDRYLKGNSHA